ncbi:hypothetical protein M4951_23730 [Blastopirellula sp. J2-11]|uniref:hypothetical protein n=1 Tax=Blastopirellula sp. J2-11 TaxID=2943192 RepID=UPI0021CA77FE|nr:hypothetical protein [Blastopirellula sp. J2-11]UUO06346.1 hypothetical protein M4951_23730 [Blastopirellula sp. J2-11]
MNAIALVLCTVIAGADARETIPTTQKLAELIRNTYAVEKLKQIEFAADGASLQTKGTPNSDGSPSEDRSHPVMVSRSNQMLNYIGGEFQLKLVPCPGHPNFLLAGYEAKSKEPYYIGHFNEPAKLLSHCFCVLIDTDRNIVVPLDDSQQRLYLNDEQLKMVSKQCEAIWLNYLQQIEKQSSNDPFYAEYYQLRRQFITLPPLGVVLNTYFSPTMPNQGLVPYSANHNQPPVHVAGMRVQLQLSAEGRNIGYNGAIEIQRLLSTTIALPAAEYFKAKPPKK